MTAAERDALCYAEWLDKLDLEDDGAVGRALCQVAAVYDGADPSFRQALVDHLNRVEDRECEDWTDLGVDHECNPVALASLGSTRDWECQRFISIARRVMMHVPTDQVSA